MMSTSYICIFYLPVSTETQSLGPDQFAVHVLFGIVPRKVDSVLHSYRDPLLLVGFVLRICECFAFVVILHYSLVLQIRVQTLLAMLVNHKARSRSHDSVQFVILALFTDMDFSLFLF